MQIPASPPPSNLLPRLALLTFNLLVLAAFTYLTFKEQSSFSTSSPTFFGNPDVTASVTFLEASSPSQPPNNELPLNPTPETTEPTDSDPTPTPELSKGPTELVDPTEPSKPEEPVDPISEPEPTTPCPSPSDPEPTPTPAPTSTPEPTDPTPEEPIPTSVPEPEEPSEPVATVAPQSNEERKGGRLIPISETAVEREGTSFYLTNGGIIPLSDPRNRFLCKLIPQTHKNCYSQYIAEHVDQLYSFSPVYAAVQDQMPMMYLHHTNFVSYMKSIGINSIVLEGIYPGQEYKVTTAGNEPWEIQVKINDYVYYRENFLNVAIRKTRHLDYEYITWIDAHQVFLNPYWWEEGIYKMARYPTVSLFHSVAHFDNNNNRTFNKWKGLYGVQYELQYTADMHVWIDGKQGQWKGWQGNAVGVRREIYDDIVFILDYCIIGCCDCSFNYATMTSYWNLFETFGNYGKQLMPWIENSRKVLAKKNGVVRGKIYHLYHEHYYGGSNGLFDKLRDIPLDFQQELYRDENFTIHIKPDSVLKDWCIPPDASKIH